MTFQVEAEGIKKLILELQFIAYHRNETKQDRIEINFFIIQKLAGNL